MMEIVRDMYQDKLCVIVEDSNEKNKLCELIRMNAVGEEVYPGVIVPEECKDGYSLHHRPTYDPNKKFHVGGAPKKFVAISFRVFSAWMAN